MNAPGLTDAAPSQQDTAEPLAVHRTAWRNAGVERFDPARFHYLERLSQRAEAATGALRRVLDDKLQAALANDVGRLRQAQQTATEAVAQLSAERPDLARAVHRLFKAGDYQGLHRLAAQAVLPTGSQPLVQLNQYLRDAAHFAAHSAGQAPGNGDAQQRPPAQPAEGGEARPEMRSVRRFRETWSRIAADDQVHRAIGRGPVNAGPLNSHMLVLRSLAWMRELSPDYLQRFLSHVDTLLWLDQASQPTAPGKARPARRRRLQR